MRAALIFTLVATIAVAAAAVPATCKNLVKDVKETDVNCGGGQCAACALGKRCKRNSDCLSISCSAGVCIPPTCSDEIKNGLETDVDCGGTACPKCRKGATCKISADCTGVCNKNKKCEQANCSDKVRNGGESDVDCGAGSDYCDRKGLAGLCATGKVCRCDDDCLSRVCAGGACAAPTCSDSTPNGAETGTDCGSTGRPVRGTPPTTACPKCPLFETCRNDIDCASGNCIPVSGSTGECRPADVASSSP